MKLENASKYSKLTLSIIFDAIGYISLIFPPFDFVWAPMAGYLMTKLYKGKTGKIAGIIVFIEEALPWLDVVPTFTLMWMYSFIFKPEDKIAKTN
jgi:hypothetical protein